jgi:hypothetical protein
MTLIYRIVFCLALLGLMGCKISFTGASIAPDVKTVSIVNFVNKASIVNPSLARNITDELKNNFTAQTSLNIVKTDGDLQFEGTITDYSVSAATILNSSSATNQLIVTVMVKFVNIKDETKNFEQSFSRFATFPANKNFASIESSLVDEIKKLLAQDIMNKAVVNW